MAATEKTADKSKSAPQSTETMTINQTHVVVGAQSAKGGSSTQVTTQASQANQLMMDRRVTYTIDKVVCGNGRSLGTDPAFAEKVMAELQMKLGVTKVQVIEMADAIDYLGRQMGNLDPAVLSEMVKELYGIAKLNGLSGVGSVALSSALLKGGVQPATAATGAKVLVNQLANADSSSPEAKKIWSSKGVNPQELAKGMKDNPEKTILNALTALQKMTDAEKKIVLQGDRYDKEWISVTNALIGNIASLGEAFAKISNTENYAGSLFRSANFEKSAPAVFISSEGSLSVKDGGKNNPPLFAQKVLSFLASSSSFKEKKEEGGGGRKAPEGIYLGPGKAIDDPSYSERILDFAKEGVFYTEDFSGDYVENTTAALKLVVKLQERMKGQDHLGSAATQFNAVQADLVELQGDGKSYASMSSNRQNLKGGALHGYSQSIKKAEEEIDSSLQKVYYFFDDVYNRKVKRNLQPGVSGLLEGIAQDFGIIEREYTAEEEGKILSLKEKLREATTKEEVFSVLNEMKEAFENHPEMLHQILEMRDGIVTIFKEREKLSIRERDLNNQSLPNDEKRWNDLNGSGPKYDAFTPLSLFGLDGAARILSATYGGISAKIQSNSELATKEGVLGDGGIHAQTFPQSSLFPSTAAAPVFTIHVNATGVGNDELARLISERTEQTVRGILAQYDAEKNRVQGTLLHD